MKLICDQMLIRLGRWLRAAGYDTLIIEESKQDKEIYALARKEDRYLITRDRYFALQEQVVWLESNELDDCAQELAKKLKIDWLIHPFSRCIVCNTPLQEASDDDIKNVPDGILEHTSEYTKCPQCQKVFWLGTHTDRMLAQLKQWAEKK